MDFGLSLRAFCGHPRKVRERWGGEQQTRFTGIDRNSKSVSTYEPKERSLLRLTLDVAVPQGVQPKPPVARNPSRAKSFNVFLIVNLVRKWKKITARRRMRQKDAYRAYSEICSRRRRSQESVSDKDFVLTYEDKPAEVEALLWAAIQKNYMLGKMDPNTVRRPTRWTNQMQEARVYSHDGPIRRRKR
eukprot:1022571-Prorocentrum_minimum.AAC.1